MIFTFANWVTVFWILFLCLSIICSLDFLFFFCVGNFAYLNSVLLYSDRTLHFCTISNGVVSPSLFLSNVETTPWKISLVFFCFGVWTRVKKTTAPEFRSRWVRSFVESRLAGSGERCKQGTTLNLLRERTGKGWVVCNRQNAAGTRRMIKNEAHGLCGRVLFLFRYGGRTFFSFVFSGDSVSFYFCAKRTRTWWFCLIFIALG